MNETEPIGDLKRALLLALANDTMTRLALALYATGRELSGKHARKISTALRPRLVELVDQADPDDTLTQLGDRAGRIAAEIATAVLALPDPLTVN